MSEKNTIVVEHYPALLKEALLPFESESDRQMMLTSSIIALSAAFFPLKGRYHLYTVHPNLYGLNVGVAGIGKGVMRFARQLLFDIQKDRVNSTSQQKSKEAKKQHFSPKGFFLPADSSVAGMLSFLQSNDQAGFLFNTETDGLTRLFESDWGNSSELLRRLYHHEPVEYLRKGTQEYYTLNHSKLTILLSGTPNQLNRLITGVEDGMFSRFSINLIEGKSQWADVEPNETNFSLDIYFEKLSKRVLAMHKQLLAIPTTFRLTKGQWATLNHTCKAWHDFYTDQYDDLISGIVKRAGLQWFRIAMILSVLRNEEKLSSLKELTCTNQDFFLAGQLVYQYLQNSAKVFEQLLRSKRQGNSNSSPVERLFSALPDHEEFTRTFAIQLGEGFHWKPRTVDNYLSKLKSTGRLIQNTPCGPYRKAN